MTEIATASGIVPVLLTEKQVEAATGVPVASLKTDRCRGVGMPYVKLGRRVRYRADDLAEYIAANTVEPKHAAAQQD